MPASQGQEELAAGDGRPFRVAFVEDNFLRWEKFLRNSWLSEEEAISMEKRMLVDWESYIDTYAGYLRRRGFECVKYVPSKQAETTEFLEHKLGHTVVRVPIGKSSSLGRDALRFIRRMKDLFSSSPPVLVHFSNYYSRFFAATGLGSVGTRVVSEYSGGELPTSPFFEKLRWRFTLRRALGRSSGVLISDLSELDRSEARVLVSTLKVQPSKLFSFPVVAVDESAFHERERDQAFEKSGFAKEKVNVVVVSGMAKRDATGGPQKDPMLILRMFSNLGGDIDWALHFVGFGPLYMEMVNEVRSKNLEKKVTFHGLVPHREIPYMYSASALVVYPFPQFDLQSGTAVNEALACGRPVVCFKKSPELETSVPGGYLVDPDPKSGGDQLRAILRKPLDLQQKGREGVKLSERFWLSNVGPRLEQIYRQLIGQGGPDDPAV